MREDTNCQPLVVEGAKKEEDKSIYEEKMLGSTNDVEADKYDDVEPVICPDLGQLEVFQHVFGAQVVPL